MPIDDAATRAALDALMVRISAAGAAAVKTSAMAIKAAGMARTRVKRGTLRRSWQVEDVGGGAGVYSARVGPTMVYARRIELGFRGADSAGRVYDEAPKPYVKPAVDSVLPRIRSFFVSAISTAIRR